MASLKVEICLEKKNQPKHKYSVASVTKVGIITKKDQPPTLVKVKKEKNEIEMIRLLS